MPSTRAGDDVLLCEGRYGVERGLGLGLGGEGYVSFSLAADGNLKVAKFVKMAPKSASDALEEEALEEEALEEEEEEEEEETKPPKGGLEGSTSPSRTAL